MISGDNTLLTASSTGLRGGNHFYIIKLGASHGLQKINTYCKLKG